MSDRMDRVRALLESIGRDADGALEEIADVPEMLHFEVLLDRIADDAKTLIMMIDHGRRRE